MPASSRLAGLLPAHHRRSEDRRRTRAEPTGSGTGHLAGGVQDGMERIRNLSIATYKITAGAALALLLSATTACGSGDDGPPATAPPSEGTGMTPPTDPVELPTVETAAELVVGTSEAEAEAAVTDRGWGFRVVRRDGVDLPVTADFRPNRVNVDVADGVVVAVISIG